MDSSAEKAKRGKDDEQLKARRQQERERLVEKRVDHFTVIDQKRFGLLLRLLQRPMDEHHEQAQKQNYWMSECQQRTGQSKAERMHGLEKMHPQ